MRVRTSAPLIVLALLAGSTGLRSQDRGIPGVVAPGVRPELVKEGFVFTEGPLGTKDGGLYFCDNRANKIFLMTPAGEIGVVRENTGGAGGLALTSNGALYAAESGSKRITRMTPDGKVTAVVENLEFPNDLIADAKGGIYFSDPWTRPVVPGRKVFVYYLPPGAAKAMVVDDAITRPNGLTLTRDGRTLIVDDTFGNTVYQMDVQTDGTLKNRRPFAVLHDFAAGKESGADGMAIDADGHVYVSTTTGVQVFDRAGAYLGTITLPRVPANIAFAGPDKKTLYITAREGLYRLKMLVKGPDRLGK
jgi:gluconolactonase